MLEQPLEALEEARDAGRIGIVGRITSYNVCYTKLLRSGGRLHLMGLLSDGGVHSHQEHLNALLRLAKAQGVSEIFVHCLMDGRDTGPRSGAGYMERLVADLASIGAGKVATVIGRYWAMDRDKRWERNQKAYDCLTLGRGRAVADPVGAVRAAYEAGENDEFIEPTVA